MKVRGCVISEGCGVLCVKLSEHLSIQGREKL